MPQCGNSFARSSLDSSVPNELMVIMKALRSASNCGRREFHLGLQGL